MDFVDIMDMVDIVGMVDMVDLKDMLDVLLVLWYLLTEEGDEVSWRGRDRGDSHCENQRGSPELSHPEQGGDRFISSNNSQNARCQLLLTTGDDFFNSNLHRDF